MCLYHDRYYQQRPVDHGLRQVLLLQLVSAELGSGPTDKGVGFKAEQPMASFQLQSLVMERVKSVSMQNCFFSLF